MEVNTIKRASVDSVGKVVFVEGKIYRLIYDQYVDEIKHVLSTLEKVNLLDQDIINTKISDTKLFPEYKLVLEHEKLDFVTYPTEWSPLEFYDAARFFISLIPKLKQLNLGLRDWHLFNVTLNNGKFIFYDFAAIKNGSTTRGSMKQIWRMVAMPLLLIYAKQWEKCHLFLNNDKKIKYKEVSNYLNTFDKIKYCFLITPFYICYGIGSVINKISKYPFDLDAAMTRLLKSFLNFYPIKPQKVRKNKKQRPTNVFTAANRKTLSIIKNLHPKWVLEFGKENAIYSPILAAEEVKSIYLDIDYKAIDKSYTEFVKNNNTQYCKNFYAAAIDFVRPTFAGRSGPLDADENIAPLLLSFKNRLPNIDITIATAIFLKSCVGSYLHFDDIIRQMRTFAKQHLLIEFPVKKPYWPKLSWLNLDWYNTENFESSLQEHFIILNRYNIENKNIDDHEENLILFSCKSKI
jgi:hypothetical protein